MIVWGGDTPAGGTYDPVSDSWTSMSAVGAPSARNGHTAVWTGSRMVVWGGSSTATGGVYDPATDTWTATSMVNAPSGRSEHTAVWTGSRMIVWGGSDSGGRLATGASYDPSTDTWTPIRPATIGRNKHAAVWTGSKMIVWGGYTAGAGYPFSSTGESYDPATDTWAPLETAPLSPRVSPSAVWTGSKMIVWGGASADYLKTGGVYDPATGAWSQTDPVGAPSGRYEHVAVWTGARMLVWGGAGWALTTTNTGGLYDPIADSWTPTSMDAVPIPRFFFAGVWTGEKLIVWGGRESGSTVAVTATGGVLHGVAPPPTPTDFHTLTPCRLLDTRDAGGPTGGSPLAGSSIRPFAITGGTCGVPLAARAVSLNVTATQASANGHLTLFAGDAAGPPVASTVNFVPGVTRANNAVVPLSTDGAGAIQVKNGSAAPVHVILDVNGYFQ
jgi:hypothetical protein